MIGNTAVFLFCDCYVFTINAILILLCGVYVFENLVWTDKLVVSSEKTFLTADFTIVSFHYREAVDIVLLK